MQKKSNHQMMLRHKSILFLTQFSILLAILAIICFTPLGSIPIGPLVATIAHIPVIITAINLGVGAGSLMGFFAGLFSFIVWSFMPPNPAIAFVFTPFHAPGNALSLVICFVPRILIGTSAGLLFKAINYYAGKSKILDTLSYIIASVCGSLVNTVFVLGGIYLFFGRLYAESLGLSYDILIGLLMGVVGTNGVLELIIAAVVAYAVCKPIRKFILHTDTH